MKSRLSVRPLPERALNTLSLAASPVFAAMAVLVVLYRDPMALLCGGGGWSGVLGGMPLMYGLMAVAHLGAWARLLARAG